MKLPVNYEVIDQYQRRDVREEYVKIQNGSCWYCNKPLNTPRVKHRNINKSLFPKSFFKYPIHLHHDRSSGMTIGAVHNTCNALLWQYHGE